MNMHVHSLDQITCPNCGEHIPISEAIYHQIAEQTRQQVTSELNAQRADLRARTDELQAKTEQLRSREETLERDVQARLAAERAKLMKVAAEEARQGLGAELADLQQRLADRDAKLVQAQKTELQLLTEQRRLQDREKELDLEIARRLSAEAARIQEDTAKRLQEEHRLRDAEKDKKLQDALRANDELRRKLEQGSQQAQGEVLELELERLIRASFPLDAVEPVPKGITGADIVQHVISRSGRRCGTIIWELKRTKGFNENWIDKLKQDQREVKADLAILVSETLPKECTHFQQMDGVWVVNPQCALNLATALRMQLEQVALARQTAVGMSEKMEVLYHYLSGTEFKSRVEAIVEAFIAMQEDLNEEKRAAERRWAKREKQIHRVISGTSGMWGDLQGLLGSSLQAIPALTDDRDKF